MEWQTRNAPILNIFIALFYFLFCVHFLSYFAYFFIFFYFFYYFISFLSCLISLKFPP